MSYRGSPELYSEVNYLHSKAVVGKKWRSSTSAVDGGETTPGEAVDGAHSPLVHLGTSSGTQPVTVATNAEFDRLTNNSADSQTSPPLPTSSDPGRDNPAFQTDAKQNPLPPIYGHIVSAPPRGNTLPPIQTSPKKGKKKKNFLKSKVSDSQSAQNNSSPEKSDNQNNSPPKKASNYKMPRTSASLENHNSPV
jgi:hypothetical protein